MNSTPVSAKPGQSFLGGRGSSYARGTLLAIGVLLAASLLAGTIWIVLDRRAVDLAAAERETDSLAVALAEQTSRTLGAVDFVLVNLLDRIPTESTGSPADLAAIMGTPETYRMLRDESLGLNQIDALSVIGADGQLINSSRGDPVVPLSVSDRQWFVWLRDHPGSGLFISEPVISHARGWETIDLVRRVETPDGRFLGAVSGAVRVDYFANLYRTVSPRNGGSVALHRRDGTMLVRYPQATESPAYRTNRNSLVQQIRDGATTAHASGISPFDGVDRLRTARAVPDLALVVITGRDKTSVLADWRRQTAAIGGGAAAVTLTLIVAIMLLGRQIARRQASEEALNATLENAVQGIVMIDSDHRLLVCNRRAMDMLDIPPSLIASKPLFEDIIRFQLQQGEFGPDPVTVAEAVRRALPTGSEPGQIAGYERCRPDGTVLEISSIPLPSGAVVRTYTDVTLARAREAALQGALEERDHAEAALRQQRDDLERELAERTRPLVASEARHRDMAEVASDWIWETDANHVFTFLSKRFGDTSGIPWVQVNGRRFPDLVELGFERTGMATLHAMINAGEVFQEVIYRVGLPSGAARFWRLSGKPFFDPTTGAFRGYRGTGTDVTTTIEHEAELTAALQRAGAAEQEAKQARTSLVEAIEAIPDAFILHDAADRLVLCNSHYGEMFQLTPDLMTPGVSYEDVLRCNATRGYHDMAGQEVDTWVSERLAEHRAPSGNRDVHPLTDGRWLQVQERRTSDGGTVGIRIDVTQARLQEAAKRDQDRTAAELRAARLMQTGLLPSLHLQQEIVARTGLDIASYAASCSELGGDLWGISDLDNGRVGVYIVDFAGHGTAAALNTFRLHTLIHELRAELLEPDRFLKSLNLRLVELLPQGAFATMFYAVIDTNTDLITYAAAGSPPPILRSGTDRPLTLIDSAGVPLGITAEADYACATACYGPGAMLFLNSDMLTDLVDKDGQRVGEAGALAVVEGCAEAWSAQAVVQQACAPFLDTANGLLSDDLTVICIRRPH